MMTKGSPMKSYWLAFLKPRKQCFYSSKRRGERRGYEWLTDVVTNVRRTSERTSARVSERVNGRVPELPFLLI